MFLTKRKLAVTFLVAIAVTAAGLVGIPGLFARPQPPQGTPKPESVKAAPAVPAVPAAAQKPLPQGPNRLLVGRGAGGGERVSLIDPTGKNEKDLLRVAAHLDGIRLSPDGTRVAYIAQDPTATEPMLLLYVAGVDDKEGQPLGMSPRAFSWSPDGTEIAYTEFPMSEKKLSATHGLINVKTGAKTELKLPDDHYITDWSRDGKHFVTTRIWPHAGVFLMNRDGTEHSSLTEKRLQAGSYGLLGRLSPDGKQLLFTILTPAKEKDKQAKSELAVLDTSTGKVTPVADIPINGGVSSYCWSPDGKRIAYAWLESSQDNPAVEEIEAQVVVCDPDGKNATSIVSDKGRIITRPGVDWR